MTSFASMALLDAPAPRAGAGARAETGYPFYGEESTPAGGALGRPAHGRNALIDPPLLTAPTRAWAILISLGDARFRVIGRWRRCRGRWWIGSLFAPAVYVPARYVPEMNLLRFGARVDYDAYVRTTPREAARFIAAERAVLRRERTNVRTPEQQQRQLDRALGQLGDFLGLVGTFALLLGGIGVASAMGAYMAQKRETVAALRCLGATAPQVIAVYLLQAGVMGLAGAGLGALLGVGVQWVLPRLLADLLPVQVGTAVDVPAVITGVGVGLWIALAFALPLLATRRCPAEALRRRV